MALCLGLGAIFFAQGCAWAPGMHLGLRGPSSGRVDTTLDVDGVTVELRSLTPRVANEEARLADLPVGLPSGLDSTTPGPYLLGPHDVIAVAVWEHPELSLPLGEYRSDNTSGQTIDDAGSFYFPYLGSIKAAGNTPSALRDRLLTGLAEYLTRPHLDVRISSYRSQKIVVHGNVSRPGTQPITDVPLSLLDAVNNAGGPAANADPTRIEIIRNHRLSKVDLTRTYQDGTDASRIWLKNGDVVRVPGSEENGVYVLGEVSRQTILPLNSHKVTLVKALAEAGGLNSMSAAARGVYVIRAADSTRIRAWHLDARNPLALAMADRFPLMPGDVIYVDATNLVRWGRVADIISGTLPFFSSSVQTAVSVKQLAQ